MQRHNDLTQTMLIPAINGRISGIFLKGIPEYGVFINQANIMVGAGF